MCFSAQADLIGGAVLTVVGLDCVRHLRLRNDHLAIVALPLLLAAHQLTETFVWWGLQGHVPRGVGTVATWVYLLVALVVLPTYVPLAIRALEPPGWRRRVMGAFVLLGAFVSVGLLAAMLHGPVTAALHPHHLGYGINLHAGLLVTTAYVLATCGSTLFSGHRHIAVFGVLNLIGVAVLARIELDGFASLWCGWAAVTAAAIALHVRLGRRDPSVSRALA